MQIVSPSSRPECDEHWPISGVEPRRYIMSISRREIETQIRERELPENWKRHVPKITSSLKRVGRLAPSSELHLSLGLPLRNNEVLDELLRDLYDPAHARYRRFLSAEDFASQFGP